jgi:hypothetical protein
LVLAKATGPAGISSTVCVQRTRLPEQSSPEVRFSFTVYPEQPALVSRPKATLVGFLVPSAHWVAEFTSCPYGQATGQRPKKLPGCLPTGPTRLTTVPLTGFLNLSATLFLLPPSSHFQAGGTHGVASFRGLIFPRSPSNSSPLACPLDVIPFGCAVLVLGQDTSRHVCHS